MEGFQFKTIKEAHEAISAAYQEKLREVKRDYSYSFFRSNPSLITMDFNGERMDEAVYYSGGAITKKLILEVADNPDVAEVWYDNGIDGTMTLTGDEFSDGSSLDYAEVLLYKRAAK